MTVYVFAGPTLRHDEIREHLDAVCLPPAAQGDVYRAALNRPRVIAVVDGYFEGVPAVWHKEVLWALDHGIHVFGSASMGALRAAELAHFGMTGSSIRAFRIAEKQHHRHGGVAVNRLSLAVLLALPLSPTLDRQVRSIWCGE